MVYTRDHNLKKVLWLAYTTTNVTRILFTVHKILVTFPRGLSSAQYENSIKLYETNSIFTNCRKNRTSRDICSICASRIIVERNIDGSEDHMVTRRVGEISKGRMETREIRYLRRRCRSATDECRLANWKRHESRMRAFRGATPNTRRIVGYNTMRVQPYESW